MMEFVSWDDDYSQLIWENKIHVPKLQPDDDWRIWRYPHDFGNLMIYHAEAKQKHGDLCTSRRLDGTNGE